MNVQEVQRKLWEQSRAHREHREAGRPFIPTNPYENRVRNLMDLMHQPDWLRAAMVRTIERSKGKAPGVDGVTTYKFTRRGLEQKFEQLRLELRNGIYQPKPLRRVEIPKADGKIRPLGIPCLRDKIVQEAIRMALEPIFEIEFHDNSYGFRPNRSAHHAVFRCQHLMRHGFTWVIEGDVKACFDEISHDAILKALREKVMDNKFLDLIDLFLKAGVKIDGKFHPTVKGVPQGGVVSPLLANTVLNKLDWFLHEKGTHGLKMARAAAFKESNVRFTRYADDWCVFLTRTNKRYAESLKEEISEFLQAQCSLQLSQEKTKVTHVRDGFDFLGFHLEQGIGQRGKTVPKIKVGQKAITAITNRLDEVIRQRPSQESIAARLAKANTVIRGWSNYFKIAHNYNDVAGKLDHIAHWTMVKAICRKHDIPSGKCHKRFYFEGRIGVDAEKRIVWFADTKMSHDYRSPLIYEPGMGTYETDMELEADFRVYERLRPGSMEIKRTILRRDHYFCQQCGRKVTADTSHLDHIKPVREFASYREANSKDNVQTLCINCHAEKTYRKKDKV
jgi:group II intron reverse transcriptase/maturase